MVSIKNKLGHTIALSNFFGGVEGAVEVKYQHAKWEEIGSSLGLGGVNPIEPGDDAITAKRKGGLGFIVNHLHDYCRRRGIMVNRRLVTKELIRRYIRDLVYPKIWYRKSKDVMYELLREKFGLPGEARNVLLATGDMLLAENPAGSRGRPSVWVAPNMANIESEDDCGLLGQLLMKVRSEI